ncbi:MAG: exodeoxyribonuclease III [Burkholderiales bacterium]
MLRIVTLNLNGIRSATSKGLLDWLAGTKADIVCLQEVKAHEADLHETIRAPKGWHVHFNCAEKKGYSGVALFSRAKPDRVTRGIGSKEFDAEGRYLQADFGGVSVVSLYVPSGSSGEERQLAKFRFLDEFMPMTAKLARDKREIVLCGDINIAHKEIDLKNWKSNQKNSGFLPEERAWLTKLFDDHKWVDVFRRLDDRAEQYTWWSNRGQAYAKNVGWRLDYHITTPGIGATANKVAIYTEQRFSDHAPLTIDYRF